MSIAELELAIPRPVSPTAKLDRPDSPHLRRNQRKRTFVYNRANSAFETFATLDVASESLQTRHWFRQHGGSVGPAS